MEGRAPWNNQSETIPSLNRNIPMPPMHQVRQNTPNAARPGRPIRLANEKKPDILMMAYIMEVAVKKEPKQPKVLLSMNTPPLSSIEGGTHFWFIDSAASSHICGNQDLFESMYVVPTITIETASGKSFTANKRGTIKIMIQSYDMDDIDIMLQEVMYALKLKVNLLSVGRVTNANVDVSFTKDYSFLSMNNTPIAQGVKVNNLFAFRTKMDEPLNYDSIESSMKDHDGSIMNYVYSAYTPSEATIWHHRLAHASYTTISRMTKLNTAIGLPQKINPEDISQCIHCPYGKQIRAPFKQTEEMPKDIGDIVASDLCGPFESSIGGFRYFVTWIDLKTRYVNIEFLKNKESQTVTEAFERYLAWIMRQKNVHVKCVRTDNGGEYTGHEFKKICGDNGIKHETTSPYTPEHNRIAERYN